MGQSGPTWNDFTGLGASGGKEVGSEPEMERGHSRQNGTDDDPPPLGIDLSKGQGRSQDNYCMFLFSSKTKKGPGLEVVLVV